MAVNNTGIHKGFQRSDYVGSNRLALQMLAKSQQSLWQPSPDTYSLSTATFSSDSDSTRSLYQRSCTPVDSMSEDEGPIISRKRSAACRRLLSSDSEESDLETSPEPPPARKKKKLVKRPKTTQSKSHPQAFSKRRSSPQNTSTLRLLRQRARKEARALGDGIKVGPSTLPNAGNGLFTTRAFRKGEFITWYHGERILLGSTDKVSRFKDERNPTVWGHRATVVKNWLVIDGIKSPNVPGTDRVGGGSFMNDGISVFCPPNTELVPMEVEHNPPLENEHDLLVRATQTIPAGEECFLKYPDRQWLRFKDDAPEAYARLLEGQQTNASWITQQVHWCRFTDNWQPLEQALARTPVPAWPELKTPHTHWHESLIRYGLFRAGIMSAVILQRHVLDLLNPASDWYFLAVAGYGSRLTMSEKEMVSEWNRDHKDGHPITPIPVPRNGVFQTDSWTTANLRILFATAGQRECDFEGSRLMLTIHGLDPSDPMYDELLLQYIVRGLPVSAEHAQTIDFSQPRGTEMKSRMLTALRNNRIAVPSSLLNSSSSESEGESEPSQWNVPQLHAYLRKHGWQVVESLGNKGTSIWFQLDQAALKGESDTYSTLFLKTCRSKACNFQSMARASKTCRTTDGIRFVPVPGANYPEDQPCNRAALLFQYIHRVGAIDCQEVYQQANQETLHGVLEIMQPDYHNPQWPTMARDLLALVTCDIKSVKSFGKKLHRHEQHIPDDLFDLTNEKRKDILQPEGRRLARQLKQLPDLTTALAKQ
ncbi:SET domain-containing protein [Parendozoicomonas haliclonae]|uniref:SET domain-containing protein n=1 Tax=Parendozoicomonas haliclonae TaxID=1960125 RepID=A0A1X7AMY8_9GAMM|nr:SET domain-containing protein [Parendozoicomonas haliclonae]SMA49415.1 hypothetical protein EHSB41UT_03247 [Parendozoicomonas haliclonae]